MEFEDHSEVSWSGEMIQGERRIVFVGSRFGVNNSELGIHLEGFTRCLGFGRLLWGDMQKYVETGYTGARAFG